MALIEQVKSEHFLTPQLKESMPKNKKKNTVLITFHDYVNLLFGYSPFYRKSLRSRLVMSLFSCVVLFESRVRFLEKKIEGLIFREKILQINQTLRFLRRSSLQSICRMVTECSEHPATAPNNL